jgi:hypothetical protein
LVELNKAALEGIGAARQASPLLDVESGFETGAGVEAGGGAEAEAGGGAATAAAGGGDAVIEAGGAAESLEEPLAPQPLSAAIKNRSASLLNAPNAFELFPMPPVPVWMITPEHEQHWPEFTKTASVGCLRKPRYLYSQTGSFASPACAGFALERLAVKHARDARAPCRTRPTGAKIRAKKM